MNQSLNRLLIAVLLTALFLATSVVRGQSSTVPGGSSTPLAPIPPYPAATPPASSTIPGYNLPGQPVYPGAPSYPGSSTIPGAPLGGSTIPQSPSASGATLGAPWDPWLNGQPYGAQPYGAPAYGANPPALWNNPPAGGYAPARPATTQPWNTMPGGTPYGTNPLGTSPWATGPAYPGAPGNPQSLFPNGFGGPGGGAQPPLRLIDNLRMRHSWVYGKTGDDVGINDSEVATSIQFPNFFNTGTPLLLSPGFAFHMWDGPKDAPNHDLPANAYSAYLEAAWKSNPTALAGADIAVSVGGYSDFNSFSDESIRIQGQALGWVRVTPQLMLKLGVQYLDRVDIQMLPAVGVLWEPNPAAKFDIFFPRPKIAFRMSQTANADVWLYFAGEYGGGSWTIERAAGNFEQIDVNDIRVGAGLEWLSQAGWRGNVEVAWVTSRDVVYRFTPGDSFSPGDSFMVRAGLAY